MLRRLLDKYFSLLNPLEVARLLINSFVRSPLSILSAFIAGGLILAIGLSNPDSSQKLYTFLSFIIGQSFMIIPLLWFLKSKRQPILKRLRLNPISKETLVFSIMLSLGVIILSDELDRVIQSFFPAPEYIVDLNGLLRPDTLLGFILLFIAVAIIAPIGEELLFRGFLQQVLEKHWHDITRAILMTALLFSMIHMNPYWFAQIYILGVLWLGTLLGWDKPIVQLGVKPFLLAEMFKICLLYTSPSPRDKRQSRMPSSA